jgi:phage tail sheath protein FI
MAIHASPGVYTQTLDYSSYASTVTSTVLALVGETRKGPSEPTFISTARQFTDTFGLPRKGDYSALAALSYLEYGSALWFRRIVGKNAVKASAGIPTALSKTIINANDENGSVYKTVDGQYIYTLYLTDTKGNTKSVVKPIPGSINVSITDPTHTVSDISFSDTQIDSSRGSFDSAVYQGITSYAHYLDYNTGEYKFTTKANVLDKKYLVIKYLKKIVDVSEQNLVLTTNYTNTDGLYASTADNKVTVPALKSSIEASTFVINIIDTNSTYSVKCKTYGDTDEKATLTCLSPKDGKTELLDTKAENFINLVTGAWQFKFATALTNPSLSVTYSYDTFRYKLIELDTPENAQNITGSLNVPVYTKSFFVYNVDEITNADATVTIDYTAKLANEYNAILVDDGNGNIIDAGSKNGDILVSTETVALTKTSDTVYTGTLAHAPKTGSVIKLVTAIADTTPSFTGTTFTLTYGTAPSTEPTAAYVSYTYTGKVSNDILNKGIEFTEYSTPLYYLNSVDYNNGEINFVLATIPTAGFNIEISCMAKYEQTIGEISVGDGGDITKSKIISATIANAVIPGDVIISVESKDGTTVSNKYVDDGAGNITPVKNTTTDKSYGTIEYRIRNTSTGAMSAEIEFKYAGGANTTDTPLTVTVSYIKEMGTITAYSYGVAYNSTIIQFYQEDFKNSATGAPTYYGYKLWLPESVTTSSADEYGRSFTLDDANATTYFLNKINSQYVEFTFYDTTDSVIPVLGVNISLSGGDDDEVNINANAAILALEDFNNTETYDISLIACPDYAGSKVVMLKLLDLCENERGDCFAIIDPPQGLSVQNVVAWHNGDGIYASENAFNSNMGALYYPWIQINNEFTEAYEWVPPSVKIVSVYAYSDNNSQVWFAPAGLNRGRILNAIKLEKILTINERDFLYATSNNCVNPICDFVSDGMVVWGQKTLQRIPTALDRVNVTRMVIYITKMLAKSVRGLLFDPDDQLTWVCYKQIVEPFLLTIKNNRGLYEYLVKCDSSTNTTSDIDNNTMVAEVWLKPTKTAERIITKFYITSTGATLGSITTAN